MYFRKIPLIGPLVECSRKDHQGASLELFTHLVISTMPFWLGGLVLYAISHETSKTYIAMLTSTLNKGELLIYSTSLLAPIFYTAFTNEAGSARAFPSRYEHAVLVAMLIAICAAMFAILKTGILLDSNFIFTLSIGCTLVGLFLRYLAGVYHKMRNRDPGEEMRKQETDFVDELIEHRGHK